MAMDATEIERLIREGIPGADVRIEDLRGDGDHYAAHVVSQAFAGKSRLDRHRMVNTLLAAELAAGVHALAIQARAPGEAAPPRSPR